jgi:hypothetical protein
MCDWKGLLNWSLKYQDGTHPSQFKEMSKEDREFIEKAFESVTLNEMKEIWKILDIVKTPEGNSEKEISERVELLELMSNYIDGPENARNIIRGKRFNEIISHFFESKNKKVKIEYGRIITQMTQNDGYIQKAAMSEGIFKFLQELNDTQDQELINMYIYLLTGILFGDECEVRKYFIEKLDGIILLFNLLIKQEKIYKNEKRLLNIFNDLTKINDSNAKEGMEEVRQLAIKKMKEINMEKKFLNLILEFKYDNKKNIDIIHIIFDDIINILELYENDISQIFDRIKSMNKEIMESKELNDEEKKEEKMFLIQVIKRIKERQKFLNTNSNNNDNKDNNKMETKLIGGKESMRIELKK